MPKPLVTWWVNNQKEGVEKSEGVDEGGDNVSRFEYEWSVKAKK